MNSKLQTGWLISAGLALALTLPGMAEEVKISSSTIANTLNSSSVVNTPNTIDTTPAFTRYALDPEHGQVVVYLKDIPLFALQGQDTITQILAEQAAIALTRLTTPTALKLTKTDGQYQLLTTDNRLLIAFTEQLRAPQNPSLTGENLALTITRQVTNTLNLPEVQVASVAPPSSSPSPLTQITNRVKEFIASTYQGRASWYGGQFHGRRTSSGEIFNGNGLTAAHRSLPFGTRVKVTNLANGRAIVVRVTDRGPFVGGRILDVSRGAAAALGMIQSGVAKVKVDVLRLSK